MRIVASPETLAHLQERGGRLFVWTETFGWRCGGTVLQASTKPGRKRAFRRVPADGLEVYVSQGFRVLPEELHVALRRFPRGVAAYWNGCPWVLPQT